MSSVSPPLNLGFVAALTVGTGSFYSLSLGTLTLGTQPPYCEEAQAALWRGLQEEAQAARDCSAGSIQLFFLKKNAFFLSSII